jgi:HTH-type transcriptional regulator / antitoxin HipB
MMQKQAQAAALKVGTVVRKRRKALHITQQELARLAGCGLVFVYNLERGKASLRFDKLLAVLGVLGLEVAVTAGADAQGVTAAPRRTPPASLSVHGGRNAM